jgi:hypothetical protein
MKYILAAFLIFSFSAGVALADNMPLTNKQLYPIAKLPPSDRTAFNETYLDKLYSDRLEWIGPTTYIQPLTQKEEDWVRFGLGWADSVYCHDNVQLKGGLTAQKAEGADVTVSGRLIDYQSAANGAVLRVFLKDCEALPAVQDTQEIELPSFN